MKILVIADSIRSLKRDSARQLTGLKKILGDIYYSDKLIGTKYFWPSSGSSEHLKSCKQFELIPYNKFSLLSFIKANTLFESIKHILKNDINLKILKKEIVNKLKYDYIQHKIELIRPDIIHLHDLSEVNFALIKSSTNNNNLYILTLHIYIGKASNIKEYNELQERERIIFTLSNIDKLQITCVSSNLKNRLLTDYPNIPSKNVSTILNGTDFLIESSNSNIRKLWNIDNKKKIILCIGGLSERKNQIQILKAITQLKAEEQRRFIILFIGHANIEEKIEFEEFCISKNIEKSAKFVGSVSITDIHGYYAQSDFVISASINEAFGLTFIEGFVYGLPAITFSDLDAINDLYDEKVMVLAKDRTVTSLKDAILSALDRNWDREYIKIFAQRYSLENMIRGYNTLYKNILN